MNPRTFIVPALLSATIRAIAASQGTDAAPTVKADTEQIQFFERRIRPLLVEHCYKCHSEKAEKIKGGLVLDTREGIRRGGDNGPAVIPGNVDDSLLIQAVRYTSSEFAMPPEKSGGKLPDNVIHDLEMWVKMGAPDPRDGSAAIVKKATADGAKNWWAFKSPRKTDAPAVANTDWPRTDIDRFLLAGLEANKLKPAGDAEKTTLLRRVYFDLVGIPPSLQEIDDYLTDTSADAFAKVVDQLLASPQFGERWGRHWLDVARYAESSGKDVNLAYPHAWRYRDYVFAAFNSGKPYDQFLREQIAGDLLTATSDKQRAERLIATGFLAIGTKSHNDQNARQFYLDVADEQIDTLSQGVLGMTISCARCHDHKFDPIPQRDYYALAGIFLSTDTRYGTAQGIQNRHPSELLELPNGAGAILLQKSLPPEERQRKEDLLASTQSELRKIFADRAEQARGQRTPPQGRDQFRFLQLISVAGIVGAELKSFNPDGSPKALAMGVQDLPNTRVADLGFRARRVGGGIGARFGAIRPPEFSTITDAHLYVRGDADKPGERVPRGFPGALAGEHAEIPDGTSGRRELAEWITSRANPLTARVFVNRVWHWIFGRGLVESCDNFGTTGAKPTNQALLDTLAVRFMEDGWDVKRLVREIVVSRAYGMSSTFNATAFAVDPDNILHWRANKRRLDAESIRDAMLFASGELQLTSPVASLIAQNGEGPIGGPRRRAGASFRGMPFPGTDEDSIINASGTYRSTYLPIARDVTPEALTVFDFVDSTLVNGRRESTNVPIQALYLLNGKFVADQASKLAARVLQAYPAGPNDGIMVSIEPRIRYAYWLIFNRAPSAAEKQAATNFFTSFPDGTAPENTRENRSVHSAWTSFCRSLFSAAEFRYLN